MRVVLLPKEDIFVGQVLQMKVYVVIFDDAVVSDDTVVFDDVRVVFHGLKVFDDMVIRRRGISTTWVLSTVFPESRSGRSGETLLKDAPTRLPIKTSPFDLPASLFQKNAW